MRVKPIYLLLFLMPVPFLAGMLFVNINRQSSQTLNNIENLNSSYKLYKPSEVTDKDISSLYYASFYSARLVDKKFEDGVLDIELLLNIDGKIKTLRVNNSVPIKTPRQPQPTLKETFDDLIVGKKYNITLHLLNNYRNDNNKFVDFYCNNQDQYCDAAFEYFGSNIITLNELERILNNENVLYFDNQSGYISSLLSANAE